MHFTLDASQVGGTNPIVLRAEFAQGGWSAGGTTQSGFSSHDIVVRFRSGAGAVTEVFSGTFTAAGDVVASFTPIQVQATAGANSIEMVRSGPQVTGNSYWILYDYVLLTTPVQPSSNGSNTPPVAPVVLGQNLPETGLLSLNLNGPRLNAPGTIAYSLGDSITDGAAASPADTYAWNSLVSAGRGWPLTNLAYGSATISDINWQILPGFVRTNNRFHGGLPVASPATIQTNHVTLMLTGYNDGRDGFGRANQTAYQAFYRSGLRHAAAYTAIPTTGKVHAQAAQAAGTWQSSSIFGGAMGRTATANGSTLTFSNLSGRAIYIGYLATSRTNMGSFSVTVDGQSAGIVPCTGAFGNRAARSGNATGVIPPNVGLLGDGSIYESPLLYRVAGLSESPHTVIVSATATVNPVTILWAAGSTSARAGLSHASGPSVWVGGTLRSTAAGYSNGDDAGMAVFTQIQSSVCAELASDGLHVQHVRAGDYFDPENAMSSDFVHPNNLGHSQIASAFLEKLVTPATDAESSPESFSFQLLSGPSGMALAESGQLTWAPNESQGPATNTIQFRVTDSGTPPLSTTQSFVVQVSEVNTRPATTNLPNASVDEGVLWSATIPVFDADLPPNLLTFSILSGPPGATLGTNGVLSWTPSESQGGSSFTVQILITDNGEPPLSVTNQFLLEAKEVNAPPVLAVVPNADVAPGGSYQYALSATDSDIPSNHLTYSKVSGPAGLTVSGTGLV
ncbi:MAG: cadherin repeat domain-containing protein, partial [Verrucomicrobiae bacterium]|nr:cadherin repeat domain-containing protein [Verrucomicrobiae bacterium]